MRSSNRPITLKISTSSPNVQRIYKIYCAKILI
nr:MAG TPA: hypothetical protein [Caudoviricetes sp.]